MAVDFFFGFCGFVVAYTYGDRWTKMSLPQFFRIQLIRLDPLVLVGATLGLLGYLFDPFGKAANEKHMDAAELRSQCALGCAGIAGSFAIRLPERCIKIAPAIAARLSCQPHSGC